MQLSLRITPDCGVTLVLMVKLSCGGQNFESSNRGLDRIKKLMVLNGRLIPYSDKCQFG